MNEENQQIKQHQVCDKPPPPPPPPPAVPQKVMSVSVICTNSDVLIKDKLLELKELIASQKPDIISITEVKPRNITSTIPNLEYQLPGYNLESACLIGENASRGNIVYINQSLQYNRSTIDHFTNQSLPNITDFIACEINLDRGEKLLFCSVNRGPNSTKGCSKQINDTMRPLCDQGQIYRQIIWVGFITTQ